MVVTGIGGEGNNSGLLLLLCCSVPRPAPRATALWASVWASSLCGTSVGTTSGCRVRVHQQWWHPHVAHPIGLPQKGDWDTLQDADSQLFCKRVCVVGCVPCNPLPKSSIVVITFHVW